MPMCSDGTLLVPLAIGIRIVTILMEAHFIH